MYIQKIQITIAKDPLYRKNQQTMCIQDPTHIFSFLLLTNYLVEAQFMPGDTHPVLSQKPSQYLRIVACLDESPSRFVHVGEIPFLRCLVETSTEKNKAHSQSNKPTSTVGSLKPPSSFDRTIHLYSAALSAEGVTVADRGYGDRFINSCLWQGRPVPTPIRNVHLGQLTMRSAWHFVRGSKSKS